MRFMNRLKKAKMNFDAFRAEEKAHTKRIIAYEKKYGKHSYHNRPRGR